VSGPNPFLQAVAQSSSSFVRTPHPNSGPSTNGSIVMGYSTDSMPHVGQVPGRSNQFLVAGFTGHGMPQVFLSSKAVVDMMMDQVEFKGTAVPLIYETSQKRLDNMHNAILEGWKDSQLQAALSPKL
jgi:hypothetical protein